MKYKHESFHHPILSMTSVQIMTVLIAVISMFIDSIMTGLFLGDISLAAYGLTYPVTMFLVAIGGLFASGSQVLAGKYAGNNDTEGLNRTLTTTMLSGLICGIVIAVFIGLYTNKISIMLGAADAEIVSLTSEYLCGICFCMPALVINQIAPTFLQLKKLRKDLIIAAIAQIIADTILDYLNVTVYHGGLWGMAMATVVSCYLYVLLLIIPILTKGGYSFDIRQFSIIIRRVIFYGLLYLVYKLATAIMSLFINRVLSKYGGVEYIAANSIIFSIELVIGAVPSGFGSSTSMLTGLYNNKYGINSAYSVLKHLLKLSVIINTIQIMSVFIFAIPIVNLFSNDTGIIRDIAVLGLKLYVLAVLPNTINYILRNFELNIGHTRSAYIICISNHLILPLIVGLILMISIPVDYIWSCFVIGQFLSIFISIHLLSKTTEVFTKGDVL